MIHKQRKCQDQLSIQNSYLVPENEIKFSDGLLSSSRLAAR